MHYFVIINTAKSEYVSPVMFITDTFLIMYYKAVDLTVFVSFVFTAH